MREQRTVRVEHVALDEPERAAGVLDEGTRRDAARADRPKEVHAKIPPCTVPIGFPCAAVASSWTSASPAANDTSRIQHLRHRHSSLEMFLRASGFVTLSALARPRQPGAPVFPRRPRVPPHLA